MTHEQARRVEKVGHLIDIKDLPNPLVLAALYNGARPQGRSFLHYDPAPMTVEQAAGLLEQTTHFEYLGGRVMKIDLSGDELDPSLYDRDNGIGSARKFIDSLREVEVPDPNNPTIREHHLSQARVAAQMNQEISDDDPRWKEIQRIMRARHGG